MNIRVLFFAVLREKLGQSERLWEASLGESAEAVARNILQPLGEEKMIDSLLFAVNNLYVPRSHLLKEGDELALIPPLAGG